MIFGQDAAARWLRRLVRRWGPVASATKKDNRQWKNQEYQWKCRSIAHTKPCGP